MKKVLIGLLMVIPLLIVGAVLLITEVVLLTPDISVTGVQIVDEFQQPVDSVVVENFRFNEVYHLYARISPSKANNKKVKWDIENADYFNKDYFEEGGEIATVNESGLVTIKSTGSFDVVLTTDDGGFTARCSFLVKSDVATSAYIVYNEKKTDELNETVTMTTCQTVKLDACARPTDVDIEYIGWKVISGEDVVSVDANGIVAPKKAGTAVIKMSIKSFDKKDETGAVIKAAPIIEDTVTIIVSEGVFKVPYYYTAASTVRLSDLGAKGATLSKQSNCSIADGVLTFTSARGEAVLTKDGQSITVWKFAVGDIMFENFEMLREYTEKHTVIIGKIPYTLNCLYAANGEKVTNVTYISSRPDVATVDKNGKVTALTEGVVKITATSGDATCSIELNVKEAVIFFKLASDTHLGIARERIYGNKWYDDNLNLTYTREKLKIIQPANIDNTRFIWTCDNTDVCSIDENGAITMKEFEGERIITVTITAKESPYAIDRIESTYTFIVRPGVNVTTASEIIAAADAQTDDIFMQKDIQFYDNNSSWHLRVYTSLYGNGFMLNWRNSDGSLYNEDIVGADILEMHGDYTVLRNIRIQSSMAPDVGFSDSDFGHKCLEVYGDHIQVQFSQFEYAQFCVQVSSMNSVFEGCVFSNSSKFSLFNWCIRDGQYCIVKNCIFGVSASPSIGFSNGDDTSHCTLEFQGFCYIYNWKQDVDMNLIGNISSDDFINKTVKKVVETELGKSKYNQYWYNENGMKYMHCGMLFSGLEHPCLVNVTGALEENGIEYLEINLDELIGFASDGDQTFNNCYIYSYGTEGPVMPGDSYTLNDETCKMLREGLSAVSE